MGYRVCAVATAGNKNLESLDICQKSAVMGFNYQKPCTYTTQFEETVACNSCAKKWQHILKSRNIRSLYFNRSTNFQGQEGFQYFQLQLTKLSRWKGDQCRLQVLLSYETCQHSL